MSNEALPETPRRRSRFRRVVLIAVPAVALIATYLAFGPRTVTHRFLVDGKPAANIAIQVLDGRPPLATDANGEIRFQLQGGEELLFLAALGNNNHALFKASGRGRKETYWTSEGAVTTTTVPWGIWKQHNQDVQVTVSDDLVAKHEAGEITEQELLAAMEAKRAELQRAAAHGG